MGNELSRSFRAWRARKMRRILLVGLDNSGKTTAFNQIGKREVQSQGTVPTVDAAYEEQNYKGMTLLITDVGGQAYLRPYWRHHFTGAQGVIYFVDSMDRERFNSVKNELRVLLVDNQLKNIPVVIFANKQDSPTAASVEEVKAAALPDLANIKTPHDVHVVGGSVLNGEGIFEALDWLIDRMRRI